MGAYYKAVNLTDKESLESYDFGNGMKLMEHSFLGNRYMDVVLNEIAEGTWKNKSLTWLCDYDDNYGEMWEEARSIKSCAENVERIDYSNAIILNNDKKEYIDLTEYVLNWIGERTMMTHPFSLLISSTTESMGGGDYHPHHSYRGTWSGGIDLWL
jgi:hypothetical protein